MSKKYNTFLKSEWWKYLKDKKLKKHKKCYNCGYIFNLQLHHYNYKYKYSGNSTKAIKYTHILCSGCHSDFHKKYGVKKDMTKEMNKFISETKKQIKYYKNIEKDNLLYIKRLVDNSK